MCNNQTGKRRKATNASKTHQHCNTLISSVRTESQHPPCKKEGRAPDQSQLLLDPVESSLCDCTPALGCADSIIVSHGTAAPPVATLLVDTTLAEPTALGTECARKCGKCGDTAAGGARTMCEPVYTVESTPLLLPLPLHEREAVMEKNTAWVAGGGARR